MRLIDDVQRRARMGRRHALAPESRLRDLLATVRAMTVLHATEPGTPYLSLFARMESFELADLDRALYESKSLVKQSAMRRTLFVFPRESLPAAVSGPAARSAAQDATKLIKDLAARRVTADGAGWLATVREAVLRRLAGGVELSSKQLRDELAGQVSWYEHKAHGEAVPVLTRALTWMSASGEIVRGHNDGQWRVPRPLWTRTDEWLGAPVDRCEAREAYAELVGRYLRTFGPVTELDLTWWFGATKGIVRQALSDLDAVQVRLERDHTGWVLPDDVDPEPPIEPWAALLPALDPTTMGWKDRGFYVEPSFAAGVFDRAGNAGTTAWWDGRVVGAYRQNEEGRIELVLPKDPGPTGRAALLAQAQRLGDWLDGAKVPTLYKTPLLTWSR
ncbi:winged helix DNA-binding domain-containing protein [Nocardia panacis]|uniref:Winged helix DNA-binding domain-containing protein n=1 Tax=Nocardia panacis TaxID=2340916 RepID=A0A3A4KEN9_9NOCA|nr:winged helix DNA-binding domain-containing protein [Nocardia panacis]RJO79178.1 winged helix DNA-binding domain-containing protein [Nocardia panacis]